MNYEDEQLELIKQQIDDLINIKNIILKINFNDIFNNSTLCSEVSKEYIDNMIDKIINILKKGNIDNFLEKEIEISFPTTTLIGFVDVNFIFSNDFEPIIWRIVGLNNIPNSEGYLNKSLFNSKVFEKNNCNINENYTLKTCIIFLNKLIDNLYNEYNETKKIFNEFNPYGSGAMKCKTHFESLASSYV